MRKGKDRPVERRARGPIQESNNRPPSCLASMAGSPRPSVLLGFAAAVVLIGLNFVAVRVSNLGLAPTWGAATRFGVAALFLMVIVRAKSIPLPRGRALLGAALYGLLFFAVFFGFIYWGLVEVPAAVASLINAAVPLMTFLLAVLVGLERFRLAAVAGGVVVIGGMALLVGSVAAGDASPWRMAAVFVASLGTAVGTVVVKGFPRSHPLATNAVGMAVASVPLLAVSALLGEPWTLPARNDVWLAFGYLVLSSLVLFPLVVWVIGEWTASASAYVVVLAPLVTVPVGTWLLHETIGLRFLGAAALIFIGVYVGALWRRHVRTDAK